jgi:hypothetical protein
MHLETYDSLAFLKLGALHSNSSGNRLRKIIDIANIEPTNNICKKAIFLNDFAISSDVSTF